MSSTIVIHVLRPYASEAEYLAHESWSMDAKSMLLLDQPPLAANTAIVFDVQLQNGQKPIRAEAKVIGPVSATLDAPGGLRVRFKRFGAATKAFIDRALAVSAARELTVTTLDPASRPLASLAPSPLAIAVSSQVSAEAHAAGTRESPGQPSGVHRRVARVVTAPANRDELLARLRARRKALPKTPGTERAS